MPRELVNTEKAVTYNYNTARKALATLVKIEQAQHVEAYASGLKLYAIKAKDGALAGDAAELKVLATRKIGELIELDKAAGKLAKGTKGKGRPKIGGFSKNPPKKELTLLDQGIDKNLANRARSLAAMSEQKFQHEVKKARAMAAAAAMGNHAIVMQAKAEKHAAAIVKRALRERKWAGKIPEGKHGVIYADPEWKFKNYSPKGKLDTSAENHYDTSDLDVIKARRDEVQATSADNSVLFLWATVPMLPQAIDVMKHWGWEYKSHVVWKKDKIGTGYVFRNKHEVLLYGTRGKIPAPAEGEQWDSVIEASCKGLEHSEKPEIFYELIEAYFPSASKIELNARRKRKGWTSWGTLEFETDESK